MPLARLVLFWAAKANSLVWNLGRLSIPFLVGWVLFFLPDFLPGLVLPCLLACLTGVVDSSAPDNWKSMSGAVVTEVVVAALSKATLAW